MGYNLLCYQLKNKIQLYTLIIIKKKEFLIFTDSFKID